VSGSDESPSPVLELGTYALAPHYYLMRSFQSAAQQEAQLDSFYGSDQWRQKYRDQVLALIETYHTSVIPRTRIFGAEACRPTLAS
jgi:hypothetical protein